MDEASQPAAQSSSQGRFDLMGWLGLLLGVAGLVTGYVYYLRTLTYPEISWWSTDQLVFDSQNSNPNLRLLDRSGKEIAHNVYATNVSVSNTGTALLERANDVNSLVRSPLVISLPSPKDSVPRILGTSIVGVSENRPVNLGSQMSETSVSLTWQHLDPGSGFRILLLYAAPRQLPIDTNVSIVGMRGPRHVDLTQQMTEVPKPPATDAIFVLLAFVAGFAILVYAAAAVFSAYAWVSNSPIAALLKAFLLILVSITKTVASFFEKHTSTFETLLTFLGRFIYYAWRPSAVLAGIVLFMYYEPTLLAYWKYVSPSTQPPLAIAITVNTPCRY